MSIHFDKKVIGKDLLDQYGIEKRYKIFRNAYKNDCEQAKALFIIRFQLKNMSSKINKIFSLLPMLFLIHFKGFMSKYWLCDDNTNECIGVYCWKSRADAERYANGIAVSFMKKRSIKDSVTYEIRDI
ncbi:YdhR family protein [Oscillospiraceae bacterium PP1C4]